MSLDICIPKLFGSHSLDDLASFTLDQTRWNIIDSYERVVVAKKEETISVSPNDEPVQPVQPVQQQVTHPVLPLQPPNATQPETFQDRLYKFTFYAKGAFDTLFWSMFMAQYGMNEYIRVGKNNGNEEMKEKNKIVEYLHSQPSSYFTAFSNYKTTKVFITDTVSDLLTCGKMKWSGLVAMSLYYQANIFVVDYERKIYLPFIVGNGTQTFVLYRNPLYNHKVKDSIGYFVDTNQQIMKIDEIQNTMIGLLHYEKPLKGVSTYKVPDLEEMATKLNLDLDDENGKLLKKTDLYTKILLKCVWE